MGKIVRWRKHGERDVKHKKEKEGLERKKKG
jgi:hypothetical protein